MKKGDCIIINSGVLYGKIGRVENVGEIFTKVTIKDGGRSQVLRQSDLTVINVINGESDDETIKKIDELKIEKERLEEVYRHQIKEAFRQVIYANEVRHEILKITNDLVYFAADQKSD